MGSVTLPERAGAAPPWPGWNADPPSSRTRSPARLDGAAFITLVNGPLMAQ